MDWVQIDFISKDVFLFIEIKFHYILIKYLGYALADAGYDVWMGNARGNVYSRKHIKYDPDGSREDRERFWTFTWHEIGIIDLPSMIDYVLQTTNQTQLHYIGHSQGESHITFGFLIKITHCSASSSKGTTSFFVMCSELPQYNEKVKLMHALAPVGYMNNAVSPVLRVAELVPTALQVSLLSLRTDIE